MQVTIQAMNRKERVSTRTGKPFTSLGIKTEQHGEKWLSGFDNEQTKAWQVGDTVDIEVATKGEYLNFSLPKNPNGTAKPDSFSVSAAELKNLINFSVMKKLEEINGRLELLLQQNGVKTDTYNPTQDLPF